MTEVAFGAANELQSHVNDEHIASHHILTGLKN
jgi:hypothetical protein